MRGNVLKVVLQNGMALYVMNFIDFSIRGCYTYSLVKGLFKYYVSQHLIFFGLPTLPRIKLFKIKCTCLTS